MLTLNTNATNIVAATNKTISWLFDVIDSSGNEYHWSTKTREESWAGNILISTLAEGTQFNINTHPGTQKWRSYTFKIVDFDGVTMERSRNETGMIVPNELTFSVLNPANTLTPSDFDGGSVLLTLLIGDTTTGTFDESNEEAIRRWRFRIKQTEPGMQKFKCVCEDFFQEYLRGDYPNTRMIKDIWFGNDVDINDNICVPVTFGTAYVPLRSVYVENAVTVTGDTISFVATSEGAECQIADSNSGLGDFEPYRWVTVSGSANNDGTYMIRHCDAATIYLDHADGIEAEGAGQDVTLTMGSRYYVLGDTSYTYTINEVRSPRAYGSRSTWDSGSYTFTQSTKNDGTDDWRVFQAIIADNDHDGTGDANGLFTTGEHFLDMPTKFSATKTGDARADRTNPADCIKYILIDFGIDPDDIDLDSFDTAKATYTTWGLEWNGALWYKEPRQRILTRLLNMCNSYLMIGEGIELHTYSKTSQKTLTKANILKTADKGRGTFRYRDLGSEPLSDCGYVTWQQDGEAQDKFLKILVPTTDGGLKTKIGGDVLRLPWVNDSQEVQKLGTLYYQRKLEREAEVFFTTKANCLALCPGDVITINHADYGGSYAIIVDSMRIRKTGRIDFRCTKPSVTLEDWSDQNPAAITVNTDDSKVLWTPPISGPLTDQDLGGQAYDLWGQREKHVSVVTNQGQYVDIQKAVNEVHNAGGGRVFLHDGTYTLTEPVYLPESNIVVEGETRDGVKIIAPSSASAFIVHNRTKEYMFKNITAKTGNTTNTSSSGWSNLIYVYGDLTSDNKSSVIVDNVKFVLADGYPTSSDWVGGSAIPDGDIGVYAKYGENEIVIKNSHSSGGSGLCEVRGYANVDIHSNIVNNAYRNGIYVFDQGTTNYKGCTVSQNNVNDFANAGIYYIEKGDVSFNKMSFKKGTTDNYSATLIGIYTARSNIIAENQIQILSTSGSTDWGMIGIYSNPTGGGSTEPDVHITGNKLRMEVNTTGTAIGIYGLDMSEGRINNNHVYLENKNHVNNSAGFYLSDCDANTVSGNVSHMTGDANDIGIYLDAQSSDNTVIGNINKNVGTGISDNGANNTTGYNTAP